MDKSIQWGILGTSFISEVMANAIHESEIGKLVAIGSRSKDTAERFAERFAIPKAYTDYDALLHDDEINAVYIGLPNHMHKEWMIKSARAGKHILCEKPFTTNITDAHEVIAAIELNNVICMEALMYRHHPLVKKLQELIHNQILGCVRLYNATYTAHIADIANPIAGGSIRNLGCYPVSLVRLLAQAEPIAIQGMGRLAANNHTDNQASVMLKFADQSIAMISTADDIKMSWNFHIHGSEGTLRVKTNPWLPECDNNKIQIDFYDGRPSIEINVPAEKSLYTYQIDCINRNITQQNVSDSDCHGITLTDSLNNTIVLETWLNQVKQAHNIALA